MVAEGRPMKIWSKQMGQKLSVHTKCHQDKAASPIARQLIKLHRYVELQLSTNSPFPVQYPIMLHSPMSSACAKDISKSWTLAVFCSRNHMGLGPREAQKLATVLDWEESSEVSRSRSGAIALKCKRHQGQQWGHWRQHGAIMFCEFCPAELTQMDRLINNN